MTARSLHSTNIIYLCSTVVFDCSISGVLQLPCVNIVLTVSLGADETGRGAVEEGQQASHSQADVGVGRPQVQSSEPGKLHLQDVFWSHLDIRNLQRIFSTYSTQYKKQRISEHGTYLRDRIRVSLWNKIVHAVEEAGFWAVRY